MFSGTNFYNHYIITCNSSSTFQIDNYIFTKVLNLLQRFPEPDTNSAGTETSQVLNQKVLKYVYTLYYNCNISKATPHLFARNCRP